MHRLTAILLGLAVFIPAAAVAETFQQDGESRFRVEFPLHDRVSVEGGWAAAPNASVTAGLRLRLSFDADFPDEAIWWQLRHEIGRVNVRAGAWRATLIEGDYLRHDEASTILVPLGRRDLHLPGPFDVAVSWRLLDLAKSPAELQVRTAQLAVLADFIRDPQHRGRLAFGFLGEHVAHRTNSWEHRVLPFSALTAIVGWESNDGRFSVRAQPTFGRRLTTTNMAWDWVVLGRGAVEWTVIAVNDLPIAIYVEGEIERDSERFDASAATGLRAALPL